MTKLIHCRTYLWSRENFQVILNYKAPMFQHTKVI